MKLRSISHLFYAVARLRWNREDFDISFERVDRQLQDVVNVAIATLGGAAIGIERQHSGHADNHFAGIRTFTLLGLLSGISAYVWGLGYQVPASILLAGAVGLILTAYAAASRKEIEATSEVAALVVLAAGFLAGLGSWALSSGMIAVTAVLLVEKTRLHQTVERLPNEGIRSGFRFALMALVVLPLLPEGPYGPWGGIRPRELWMIVLFISGLSFCGFAARLLVGPGKGYVLTGLLGGVVSSTNITLTLSKTSAKEPTLGLPLASGVIAASAVMYIRVSTVCFILNPALGMALLPYLSGPALTAAGITLYGWRENQEQHAESPMPKNPLDLGSALQMAVLFQFVLFIIAAMGENFGQSGMMLSGAVLGLTDMDALTFSMAKASQAPQLLAGAAASVALGCISNTLFKLGIALGFGRGVFRSRVGVGFGLMLLAALLSFFYTLNTGQPAMRIKS